MSKPAFPITVKRGSVTVPVYLTPTRGSSTRKLTTNKRVVMDLADFFKEPDAGFIPCHTLTDEEREAALALFRERQAFGKHWD